jgi:TrmH family RNA methyltransferase
LKHVSSRDNPQFRRLARLARSRVARRDAQRLLLDGVHLIEAYLNRYGAPGVELVARRSDLDRPEVASWLARIGERASLVLADALFDSVAPVEAPTGLLAVVPMPMPDHPRAEKSFKVLLDGIQDPGNLGAILRSAAAAGAEDIFMSAQCADPWSPRCLRGAMGAHFLLRLHDRAPLLEVARQCTAQLIAADPSGPQTVFDAALAADAAFIIGSEGQGIDAQLLLQASCRVRIAMAAGVESLNAAAAATLLFYEWHRRHS